MGLPLSGCFPQPDSWHCFERASAKGILEGAGPRESAEARHEVPARSMLVCYGREPSATGGCPAEASWGEGVEVWTCVGAGQTISKRRAECWRCFLQVSVPLGCGAALLFVKKSPRDPCHSSTCSEINKSISLLCI